MSDIEIETPVLEASPEARTWARQMIEQYRAVDALHHAVPRWQIHPDDDYSWDSKEDAIEAGTTDPAAPFDSDTVTFFLVCQECGVIENGTGDRGYEAALWPCATARAMGHTE